MGILRRILSRNTNEEKQRTESDQSLGQMQQTNRCNRCGGELFQNRIKRSQMICANCGNRVYLY